MGGPDGTAVVQLGEHGRFVKLGTYSLGRGTLGDVVLSYKRMIHVVTMIDPKIK